MAQPDSAAVQKLLQEALAQQAQSLQNQLGAQYHGRHRQAHQALHGGSAGVPGSRSGGGAGGSSTIPTIGTVWVNSLPAEPLASPAIEEAGIRAGEIIAWRVWRLEKREKIVPKIPLRPLPYVSRDRLAPSRYETEVVSATPILRSTYKGTIWEPGQTVEAHADPAAQRYDSETKANANFVGIFAWKTLGQLCQYVQKQLSRLHYDPFKMAFLPEAEIELFVTGQIALWGSVIEHEHGYRAQFAKPHRLFMVCNAEGRQLNEPLRVELCKLYGLPEEGV